MARFEKAPVADVAPRSKQKQPSPRAQIQQQYRDALRDAMASPNQALVVVLEGDDKPLTIRNRIKRAAEALNVEDLTIRRRRDRIIAYKAGGEDNQE